jgi:membrane-associated protease RseP (regulator of RpoE activity)
MLADHITPLSFAVVIAALAVNLILHEAAHALVARRAGCRVARVSLGVGPVLWTPRISGADVLIRPIPLVGHVMWESARASRATRVRVALAGPLVTLALAVGLIALGGAVSAPAARGLLVLGALGLVPFMPGSDAAGAWAALRSGAPDAPQAR